MTGIKPSILITLLTSAMVLASCAGASDKYPSLAIRDAERAYGAIDAPPAQTDPYVPEPPAQALLDRIAQLQAEAESSHAAFIAGSDRARGLARDAAGSPVASRAWSAAEVVLADLEGHRIRTGVALADLETILVDSEIGGTAISEISSARDVVAALASQESAIMAELRSLAEQ